MWVNIYIFRIKNNRHYFNFLVKLRNKELIQCLKVKISTFFKKKEQQKTICSELLKGKLKNKDLLPKIGKIHHVQ